MWQPPSAEVDAAPREIEGQLSFPGLDDSPFSMFIKRCLARGDRVELDLDGTWTISSYGDA